MYVPVGIRRTIMQDEGRCARTRREELLVYVDLIPELKDLLFFYGQVSPSWGRASGAG